MGIIDAIIHVTSFIVDIFCGKRFGFASVVWGWLGGICLIASVVCFALGWPIPGVVCAAGCIACDIKAWRCHSREMKEYQEKKSEENPGRKTVMGVYYEKIICLHPRLAAHGVDAERLRSGLKVRERALF